MKRDSHDRPDDGDPAAVFASARSLWEACHEAAARDSLLNLSECYNGIDQLMRQVMRIGQEFEEWACLHVAFDELGEVWPYFLEDRFGAACLEALLPSALTEFDETDCLRVALRLRLPVKLDEALPIPVDVHAENPVSGSGFRKFRIQTVRTSSGDDEVVPFTESDDPFDENFGSPYFGIYGIDATGEMEHISDRSTYMRAIELLSRLAPGIQFPSEPALHPKHRSNLSA